MRKVAIVGAGASGLMCAICAVSSDVDVVLFDKNSHAGKKLLATGNGRCNYWNSDQSFSHYHSSSSFILSDIITESLQQEVLALFEKLGVVPHIRDGYYYPYSNQASSIQNLLQSYAKKLGVEFAFDTSVLDVFKDGEQFTVVTSDGKEFFDDVVIATGSKASPKTGSTGDGYLFAKKFGHSIVSVFPALVQVVTEGDFLKDWAGVRCSCLVSLYEKDKLIRQELGEIQLTDYGVSGICVFNLSRYISNCCHEPLTLQLNFLPFLKEKSLESIFSWFVLRGEFLGDVSLVEFLEGILPYKLFMVILKRCHISHKKCWNDLLDVEKRTLVSMMLEFSLIVVGTKDFSFAQVCRGGVSLAEVNNNLESKIVSHLYFVGEVLDVDGDCGGYNLGFAWMSGMIVGKALRGDIE